MCLFFADFAPRLLGYPGFPRVKQITTGTILIFLSFSLLNSISDPDLWWHLSVGKWIISNFKIPEQDYWNRFSGKSPWIAYSWLCEVCFAAIDQIAGVRGLYFAQAILGAVYVYILYFAFSKLSKNTFSSLILSACLTLASYPFFSLRPQTISWILFALLIYLLESRGERSDRKSILYIFLIFVVWANSHITSCIGIACLSIWLFPSKKLETSFFMRCFLLAFLATLCTPYLGKEWFVLLGKYTHAIEHSYIEEFQHASVKHIGVETSLALTIYLLLQALKNNIPLNKLAFSILLLIGSLLSIKFVPYSLICTSLLIAKYSSFKKMSFHYKLGLSCFIIFAYSSFLFHKNYEKYTSSKMVPDKAVDFLIKNNLPHPILHDFNIGGYLSYRFLNQDGSTRHKAILDGRTNVNHPEILRAFLDTWHGNSNWQRYFFLAQPQTVLWQKNSKLTELLSKEKDWCQIYPGKGYADEIWVVFEKRTS